MICVPVFLKTLRDNSRLPSTVLLKVLLESRTASSNFMFLVAYSIFKSLIAMRLPASHCDPKGFIKPVEMSVKGYMPPMRTIWAELVVVKPSLHHRVARNTKRHGFMIVSYRRQRRVSTFTARCTTNSLYVYYSTKAEYKTSAFRAQCWSFIV